MYIISIPLLLKYFLYNHACFYSKITSIYCVNNSDYATVLIIIDIIINNINSMILILLMIDFMAFFVKKGLKNKLVDKL